MKKTEVQTRTETREVEVSVTCDICGLVVEQVQYGDVADWSTEPSSVQETSVFLRTGISYMDAGDITQLSVDICPTCFKEKLIPWLKILGAEVREKDLSY